VLKYLIYFLARALNASYRYKVHGRENLKKAQDLSPFNNYLLAIWHQNLLHGILAQTGLAHVVIVSRSRDAEAVAFTCARLGHQVARGSSRNSSGVDKGGRAAMGEMQELLKKGLPGALTVDGPKGPAREAKPGIFSLAQKTQIPIIPYMPIPRSYWAFKSWDKFRLPKPFSVIDIYYGMPILVKESSDTTSTFDDYQSLLKQALDKESLL